MPLWTITDVDFVGFVLPQMIEGVIERSSCVRRSRIDYVKPKILWFGRRRLTEMVCVDQMWSALSKQTGIFTRLSEARSEAVFT